MSDEFTFDEPDFPNMEAQTGGHMRGDAAGSGDVGGGSGRPKSGKKKKSTNKKKAAAAAAAAALAASLDHEELEMLGSPSAADPSASSSSSASAAPSSPFAAVQPPPLISFGSGKKSGTKTKSRSSKQQQGRASDSGSPAADLALSVLGDVDDDPAMAAATEAAAASSSSALAAHHDSFDSFFDDDKDEGAFGSPSGSGGRGGGGPDFDGFGLGSVDSKAASKFAKQAMKAAPIAGGKAGGSSSSSSSGSHRPSVKGGFQKLVADPSPSPTRALGIVAPSPSPPAGYIDPDSVDPHRLQHDIESGNLEEQRQALGVSDGAGSRLWRIVYLCALVLVLAGIVAYQGGWVGPGAWSDPAAADSELEGPADAKAKAEADAKAKAKADAEAKAKADADAKAKADAEARDKDGAVDEGGDGEGGSDGDGGSEDTPSGAGVDPDLNPDTQAGPGTPVSPGTGTDGSSGASNSTGEAESEPAVPTSAPSEEDTAEESLSSSPPPSAAVAAYLKSLPGSQSYFEAPVAGATGKAKGVRLDPRQLVWDGKKTGAHCRPATAAGATGKDKDWFADYLAQVSAAEAVFAAEAEAEGAAPSNVTATAPIAPQLLVYSCSSARCARASGLAAHIEEASYAFLLAVLTGRVLVLDWAESLPLFRAPALDPQWLPRVRSGIARAAQEQRVHYTLQGGPGTNASTYTEVKRVSPTGVDADTTTAEEVVLESLPASLSFSSPASRVGFAARWAAKPFVVMESPSPAGPRFMAELLSNPSLSAALKERGLNSLNAWGCALNMLLLRPSDAAMQVLRPALPVLLDDSAFLVGVQGTFTVEGSNANTNANASDATNANATAAAATAATLDAIEESFLCGTQVHEAYTSGSIADASGTLYEPPSTAKDASSSKPKPLRTFFISNSRAQRNAVVRRAQQAAAAAGANATVTTLVLPLILAGEVGGEDSLALQAQAEIIAASTAPNSTTVPNPSSPLLEEAPLLARQLLAAQERADMLMDSFAELWAFGLADAHVLSPTTSSAFGRVAALRALRLPTSGASAASLVHLWDGSRTLHQSCSNPADAITLEELQQDSGRALPPLATPTPTPTPTPLPETTPKPKPKPTPALASSSTGVLKWSSTGAAPANSSSTQPPAGVVPPLPAPSSNSSSASSSTGAAPTSSQGQGGGTKEPPLPLLSPSSSSSTGMASTPKAPSSPGANSTGSGTSSSSTGGSAPATVVPDPPGPNGSDQLQPDTTLTPTPGNGTSKVAARP